MTLLVSGLLLNSCGLLVDDYSAPSAGSTLKVSSTFQSVMLGSSISFNALGGLPPYRYAIVSGVGSLNETTGMFTASAVGAVTIRASDRQGDSSDSTITVFPSLLLTPSTGKVKLGGLQTKQFFATGGIAPYSFTIQSGLGSINSDGVYTAPSGSGMTVVRVTDSQGNYKESKIENSWFRTNGTVTATLLTGGSLYIGGSFSRINPYEAPGAIVVNQTTGTPVSCNFKEGFNGGVYATVTSGDFVYFGGAFTTYQGQVANRLARVNMTSCELDTAFSPPANNGFNAQVRTLLISGTSLYVGGDFTAYKTIADSANRIAKLHLTTGVIDTTFSPVGATSNGFTNSVLTLAATGTSLYVGGYFFQYKNVNHSAWHIAKLDLASGDIDTTFSPPGSGLNGFDEAVQALAIAGDSIYVGGVFTAYKQNFGEANRIAKLNLTTGAIDTTFSPPATNGFNSWISSLLVSGSSLYVGGTFTEYRGVANSANKVAKLNLTTGAIDTTFSPPGLGANGFGDGQTQGNTVYAMTASSSSLYLTGHFTDYKGVAGSANKVAKLDLTTGAIDSSFNTAVGKNFYITGSGLTLFSDGSLMVYGGFNSYGGEVANNIAKLDPATFTLDTAFNPSSENGFDGPVYALATAGTSLYVGGNFSAYKGIAFSASRLAKLSLTTGAIDTNFSPLGFGNNGVNFGSVNALALSGTSLYFGGYFTSYRGASASNIAKVDLTSGVLDSGFSPATNGFDGTVYALTTAGTSLYVGGDFSTYKNVATSANKIAKLDLTSGVIDTTFSPAGATANGFDSSVRALAVSGTSLFVGGEFTTYKGIANSANRIAKLHLTTGVIDTTYCTVGPIANGFDNMVRALVISGSSIFVGGDFSSHRGVPLSANHLAKLDLVFGNLDSSFGPPGAAANGFNSLTSNGTYNPSVYSLLVSGTSLYTGGYYYSYKGRAEAYLSVIDTSTAEPVY